MIAMLLRRAPQAAVCVAALALLHTSAQAATPPAGTVSEGSAQASWTGGPKVPTGSATCSGPGSASCDNYKLTIVPASFPFKVEIRVTPKLADDYDLEVYNPDGTLAGSSGSGPGEPEAVILNNPAAGIYTVSASPFAALTAFNGTAKLSALPAPPSPSTETPPRYAIYQPTDGLGTSAGEPTLGVNERTGSVMYIAGTQTLKANFDDCTSPAAVKWKEVSAQQTSQVTFDPILFTDQALGRTFVSQLLPSKVSLLAFTDNDGITWLPSQGSGINSGVDHQSVGGGPFAPGLLKPTTSYPHIVYYCSQDIAIAQCAASLDGGLTFGPAVPIYNMTQCGGLHGHIKVGPDGSAYVPNKSCGGEQGVSVTRDNGLTWTVHTVPGSTAGSWDPSVAIATDDTVYFGYMNGDGHPYAAVSHDGGETWTNIQDVGIEHGIENIAFPVVVAGDGDRAAFAFLGTTTGGDLGGEDPNSPAVWHLYVSHTYDGGASWVTTDATPDDPVQRGTICSGGTLCGATRNLLDFNDVTTDARGRVVVGYADGCVGGCVANGPNSGTAVGSVARQMSGKGLYADFDEPLSFPAAPAVMATSEGGIVHLTWSTPDDRGTPISGYRIYRRPKGGSSVQIHSVSGGTNSWDDTPSAGTTYTYRVKAVNGIGEGPACREVAPVEAPPKDLTCNTPGARVATDPKGDAPIASLDVESLSVAEPLTDQDGEHQIAFTLKVAGLSSLTPGSAWMIMWNRPVPDATYDRNFVVMRATGPGTAEFKYGKISPPSVNQATDLGNASGNFSPDGTITIFISAEQADGVTPGMDLSALEVRTFAANVSGMPVSQATSIDHTGPGNHTLAGTEVCGGE